MEVLRTCYSGSKTCCHVVHQAAATMLFVWGLALSVDAQNLVLVYA